MRRVLVIVLLFNCFCGVSQQRYMGYAEVSHGVHVFPEFMETSCSFGTSIILSKGVFTPFCDFQFGGNLGKAPTYQMNYYFLGLGMKYRIRALSKKYSPSIKFHLATELGSNYRGKYLETYSEQYFLRPSENYYTDNYSGQYYPHNIVYYYVSTPLVGSFSIGNEFRLMEGLFLNFSLGYSFRKVNVRLKKMAS